MAHSEFALVIAQNLPDLKGPTIAIFPGGDVWEDFYGTLGVSFDSFCNEFTGSWQFKMVKALGLAGVRSVSYYSSLRVTRPTRYEHIPTGSTICLLPAPRSYRKLYKRMVHPHHSFGGYWGPVDELFGPSAGYQRFFNKVRRYAAPYLAMSTSLLAKEIMLDGCRAILCQDYECASFDKAVIVGLRRRIPVFGIFQGSSADWNKIGRVLHPITLKLCSGLIIGSSTEIKRVGQRYHLKEDKIHKIVNPIDPLFWLSSSRKMARQFFGLPPDATVIAWHGRVEMVPKGLDNLLTAWEQVCRRRQNHDLRLMLMGAGRDTEILAQRITGAKNIVLTPKFTCDQDVIRQFLTAADIYAFPSRYEGFPVAPTEAMACGLPVVAAEASGIRDIFEAGEGSGALVVPVNDSAAFAEALGRLIDDPTLRHSLGRRARQRAMHFSAEKVGEQLKNLLLGQSQEVAPTGAAAA